MAKVEPVFPAVMAKVRVSPVSGSEARTVPTKVPFGLFSAMENDCGLMTGGWLRLTVAEVLFEVIGIKPKVADAEAVLVTNPAVTSAAVVVYVPVQAVDSPGFSGLVALAQLIFAGITLLSAIV